MKLATLPSGDATQPQKYWSSENSLNSIQVFGQRSFLSIKLAVMVCLSTELMQMIYSKGLTIDVFILRI